MNQNTCELRIFVCDVERHRFLQLPASKSHNLAYFFNFILKIKICHFRLLDEKLEVKHIHKNDFFESIGKVNPHNNNLILRQMIVL